MIIQCNECIVLSIIGQKDGAKIQISAIRPDHHNLRIKLQDFNGVLCKEHFRVPGDDFDPEMEIEPEEEALPEDQGM
jgi:hypothetical protein